MAGESPSPLLCSVAETASLLNITERYVAKLIASRDLPSVKLGRRRLIRHDDLMKFIESRTERRSA
jgi:excisionase family DNA binding protein